MEKVSDYRIRFAPVAGTGPGQSYTITDKPNVESAIKLAKIRHDMDFGFMNVHQRIVTIKIWNWTDHTWDDITAEVEI